MEPSVEEFGGPFLDYMIDIETGSLNAELGVMFQIGAVRFSAEGKAIHSCFKVALQEDLPNRWWDEGTRNFWLDRAELYAEIVKDAKPAAIALKEFVDWVCQDGAGLYQRRFWAKPTHFDWGFVNSYLRQVGLMQPFHFREAMDVNSYVRGRGHWNGKEFWAEIPEVEGGQQHDALIDCLYQVRGVFAA